MHVRFLRIRPSGALPPPSRTASPGSAGVPPASCPCQPPSPTSPWPTAPGVLEQGSPPGCARLAGDASPRQPGYRRCRQPAAFAAWRPLSFISDSAGSDPVGGHRISRAEEEQWRRSGLIEVAETGEAVPGLVRAGRPRSPGGRHSLKSLLPLKVESDRNAAQPDAPDRRPRPSAAGKPVRGLPSPSIGV